MFVGVSMSIYVATSISNYCDKTITSYSVEVKKYIEEEYPDNIFVKNGVSIAELNEIVVYIDNGKEFIKIILPILDTDNYVMKQVVIYTGIFIDDYVSYIMQKMSHFAENKYAKTIKIFTDKYDTFTVSSILNGFKTIILKKINKLILISLIMVNIPFYIYILLTIIIKLVKSKLYKRKQRMSMATVQEMSDLQNTPEGVLRG